MNDNARNKDLWVESVVQALFMGAVFLVFFHPVKFGDFWWHLTTGRWIVEHMSLPSSDILSFSTSADVTIRKTVMLKNYWLFQTGIYLTYKWFGFMGIAALNAAMFASGYYLLFSMLRRGGFDLYVSMIVLAPSVILASTSDEVRPHSVSFLFVLVLYHLLETGMGRLRDDSGMRIWAFGGASVVMLLWGNLHPGLVMGYAVIAVFLFAESVRLLRSNDQARYGRIRTLWLWCVIMVLCSFLNPTGVLPLVVGIVEPFQWATHEGIVDHSSAWQYARSFGAMSHFVSLTLLFVITSTVLLGAWRRLRVEHLALFAVFALAAFMELRLTMFFGLLSVAVAAGYPPEALRAISGRLRLAAMILVLCVTAYFVSLPVAQWRANPKPYYSDRLPERAAEFMMDMGLPGPIYNTFNWGGYLSWRTYPEKVFITALLIDREAYVNSRALSGGLNNSLLNSYGIRTEICDPVQVVDGKVSGLVISLLRDKGWTLVYMDEVAVIFVRTDGLAGLDPIDKSRLLRALLGYSERKVEQNPDDESAWNELSALYFGSGQWDKAAAAMENAKRLAGKGGR